MSATGVKGLLRLLSLRASVLCPHSSQAMPTLGVGTTQGTLLLFASVYEAQGVGGNVGWLSSEAAQV